MYLPKGVAQQRTLTDAHVTFTTCQALFRALINTSTHIPPYEGFPGPLAKESALPMQERLRFDSWVEKEPLEK